MDEVIGTYECHLVPNWNQDGILDAVSQHANYDVEAVGGEWREYPWSGVECVVTDRDKKSDETHHAVPRRHE